MHIRDHDQRAIDRLVDAYTWFMTDVEWGWMKGETPLDDW